ncbi:ATP-dependent DNA helicase RecG [Segatella copri]|uniref:ATP-dependent DNA helicase RecG n=2 Tax=Segatella copri TaxID=165179 RepID=UPI003368946D
MTNMSSILDQDIQFLPSVGTKTKEILSKELGIRSYGDLLEYYPYKYVDRSKIFHISELTSDMPFVQLKGKILSYEEVDIGKRNKMLVAHFSDGYGVVDLVWFRSAQYIIKSYKVGTEYIVFGKPSAYNGRFRFAHPDIDDASKLQISEMGMQPFYGLTENMKKRGYTSRSIERITRNLVSILPPLPETLPDFIVNRLHLVSRDAALRMIHYPHSHQEMQKAQVRLKFEELFYVQLNILRYASDQRRKYRGYIFNRIGDIFNGFYAHHLPFELTGAQKRVMHEIRADMCSGRQMNRLLQGDVGSGKTLVALMTMLIALDNGYQACLMAPTEILAEQHLQTIRDFLQGMDIRVELLTGIVKGKKRKEILDGLATGDIQILIGTHAVIEDPVAFHRLGVAVIDEQHRFGVAQRAKLWAKSENPPHVLVMTATPIPRTLAMTIYGDLDVSVIDELPPGRKPIQTLHKFDNQLTSLYQSIRRQINLGRQVYIVFPLIKENEKIDLKNLEEGYETLKQAFPEFRLSKIHGRMKSAEKEAEMEQFVKGKTQILVATTVIEVGVNVPNASVMVILDAQRFGLSQLHQLRGRVGRGCDQSYCILVTGYKLSEETRKRIDIMCDTNDGFRIAEADLKLRGPGDLEGTQQSGMAFDLKIANIARDGQLVQLARTEAQAIIDADPQCEHPQNSLLWNRLRELKKTHINWAAIS